MACPRRWPHCFNQIDEPLRRKQSHTLRLPACRAHEPAIHRYQALVLPIPIDLVQVLDFLQGLPGQLRPSQLSVPARYPLGQLLPFCRPAWIEGSGSSLPSPFGCPLQVSRRLRKGRRYLRTKSFGRIYLQDFHFLFQKLLLSKKAFTTLSKRRDLLELARLFSHTTLRSLSLVI